MGVFFQAGREVTPRHFQENPGFYPQADMAPPPSRGFIPPTMPPMFSGGLTEFWRVFFFVGSRCSPDHPCVPTPGGPESSGLRPVCPTKPSRVCCRTGPSCREGGDFCYHYPFADHIQLCCITMIMLVLQSPFSIKYESKSTITELSVLSETQSRPPWPAQPRLDEEHPNCEETAGAEVFPQGGKNSGGGEQWIYERSSSLHLQPCIASQWIIKTGEKWSKDSGLEMISNLSWVKLNIN